MKKNFVNVYTEMTIKEARLYKRPLEDSDGKILQKRQWKMDLHEIVPECHHECITDRGEEVPLICDIECRRDGEIKSYATKDDIVKIAR